MSITISRDVNTSSVMLIVDERALHHNLLYFKQVSPDLSLSVFSNEYANRNGLVYSNYQYFSIIYNSSQVLWFGYWSSFISFLLYSCPILTEINERKN